MTERAGDGQGPVDARHENDAHQDRRRFHRPGQTLAELFEMESTRRVSKNAHKWLNIAEYESAGSAIAALKSKGYRICVSSLSPEAQPLADVSLDASPVAFVFGNERSGVSSDLVAAADELFTIPMFGFVESTNISVAAAVVASHVAERARSARDKSFLERKYFLPPSCQADLYRDFLFPRVPERRRSSQITSKHDVTRLGSNLERLILRRGMYVHPGEGADSLASQSFARFLEEYCRLGSDTGAPAARYFVKRSKAGALGDYQFEKRCGSISEGIAGLAALSCESWAVAVDGAVPMFATRHRLAPCFRKVVRIVNDDFSALFDEVCAPAVPVFAQETEQLFGELLLRTHGRAWRVACEYFGDIAGESDEAPDDVLCSILRRATVVDVARMLAATMRCSQAVTASWERVARAMTDATVSKMTALLRKREPLRGAFLSSGQSFAVGVGGTDAALTARELNVLQICLRLSHCAHVVSCVHQAAWEREMGRGTRLVQSVRFGLMETCLVDMVAEMKLLGAEVDLKEARCLYEVMCSIEELRTAADAQGA
jgi:tRNA(Leu) C34 or U34 (ribose-2'-O)-methylase TrmL